ncbi:hypothetical protein LY78DRAFT_42289 [Colletotrichum sublineola]|nr:hypothetical protein LY78DRAFT_42289 [Colletotrichum sublineola]
MGNSENELGGIGNEPSSPGCVLLPIFPQLVTLKPLQSADRPRPNQPKKTPTTTTTKHPPSGGLSPTASQASTRDIFFRLSDSLLIISSSRYDPRAWPGLLGRSGLIGNHPHSSEFSTRIAIPLGCFL